MGALLKTSSWKTTLCGLCVLLGALGAFGVAVLDSDDATEPNVQDLLGDIKLAIVLLTAGMGAAGASAVLARDNDKSSESVGAKESGVWKKSGYASLPACVILVIVLAAGAMVVIGLSGCETPSGSYTLNYDNAIQVLQWLDAAAVTTEHWNQTAITIRAEWHELEQQLEEAETPSEREEIMGQIRELALEALRSRVLEEVAEPPEGEAPDE